MRKLFYEDIRQTDFEATVLSCELPPGKNTYAVTLDATAFFPEEGGQSADIGALNGQPVLDVQIKQDLIYHYVAEPLTVGSTVSGHVDWAQRFDFMQQHSGEHIVSGLVHNRFGYNNVGFHLSVNEVTLDFNGELTAEQLQEIETEANRVVYRNLPIQVTYPSAEELAALSYRSKIEIEGQVRIITIPGIDICACCAPHVATTGEIGLIKIVHAQNYKGGMRLTIVCGMRALEDYRTKQNSVTSISVALSAKQNQVADAVLRLKDDILKQKEKYNALQARYLNLSLSALPAPEQSADAILFVDSMDSIAIRSTVNTLIESYSGYCAIFSGSETDGYQFIIGSKERDCNALAQNLRQKLSAKCGGSPTMIQGSVTASPDCIRALLET